MKNALRRTLLYLVATAVIMIAAFSASAQSVGLYTGKMADVLPNKIGTYELTGKPKISDEKHNKGYAFAGSASATYQNPKTGATFYLGILNFQSIAEAERALVNTWNHGTDKITDKTINATRVGRRKSQLQRNSWALFWTNGSLWYHLNTESKLGRKLLDLTAIEKAIGR